MTVVLYAGGEKTYKKAGDEVPTYEEKVMADKLDRFLQLEIPKIEEELLRRRKKRDVVYWYEFGKKLEDLWKKASKEYALPKTELFLFLEATQYYTKLPFSQKTLIRHPMFVYAYYLSKLPFELISKEKWRTWVEFFDSAIKEDPRIMMWVNSRSKELSQKPIRSIFKQIRKNFRNIDTTIFSTQELFAELDKIIETCTSKK